MSSRERGALDIDGRDRAEAQYLLERQRGVPVRDSERPLLEDVQPPRGYRPEVRAGAEDRDFLQGTQADLPDPRRHRLQRERRSVAGVDRSPGPSDSPLPALPLEVGPELFPARATRARHALEPQEAHRDFAPVWDSRPREILRSKAKTARRSSTSPLPQWDSRHRESPAKSEDFDINLKNPFKATV